MFNTLLFIHFIVALLLVAVVLLQKTSTDGLSGIGGGSNMGLVSGRSAATFLTRTTVILAAIFFVNAIVLANLSTKSSASIAKKIEKVEQKLEGSEPVEETSVPLAK